MNIYINISLLLFLLVFNLILLYRYYFKYKKFLHLFNYLILSALIIINFNFITLEINTFLPKIFSNIGLNYDASVKNSLDPDLYSFITSVKTKLGSNDAYCILVVAETNDKKNETVVSLMSRLAKYKIIYYLLPTSFFQNITKSKYLIIINYPKIPLTLNIKNKIYRIEKFNTPFSLLDLKQGIKIL